MSEMNNGSYVGYEYKKVKVSKEQESLWRDSMSSFGWQLEKREAATVKRVWGPIRVLVAPLALIPGTPFRKMVEDHPSDTEVELSFKRDRNIHDKAELDRLEARFTSYARGIENLENAKSLSASIAGYIIGLVGTICMAVAMFTYLAASLPIMIVFAAFGLIGWVAPYFVYQSMKRKKTDAINPKIDEQNENIHDVCRDASSILSGI